jgi:solute:Na+ symporter, SSS family
MQLASLDWIIIAVYFVLTMSIGLWVSRQSGNSSSEFFLGNRSMSWWLLGVSMVATTFSADTPNLVTDLVRKDGVAGNWAWWAFLLTGMLTVFVYARLWRRSGITTDLEFYELRYSGAEARFLRGFRALYLGVFFNVVIMASVLLAGNKIAAIMLGLTPLQTVVIVSIITVIYSAKGGYKGVIYTDFFQFVLAMIGMVAACIYIVGMPEIGGLDALLSHPNVQPKKDFLPDLTDSSQYVPLLLMPLAVQWWSVWYPGAEPGGGGYIAQRMLSAKDEKNAVVATLIFNLMHYALRPWPWILIAFASMVIFPSTSDIAAAFPNIDPTTVSDDLGFSAVLTYLPAGLLGLVVAALIAALMSTISTHLNWGSSYVVNDFYKRFVNPEATEQQQVNIGRWSTVGLMILAAILSLFLESAKDAFNIMLQIGAGTGLLFILRWFWWRVNAASEIAAMVISFLVSLGMTFGVGDAWESHIKLLVSVGITSIVWIVVALMTKPTDDATLFSFYRLIRPYGAGWDAVRDRGMASGAIASSHVGTGRLTIEIAMMITGCVGIYSLLFGIGFWIYGQGSYAMMAMAAFLIAAWTLNGLWKKIDA